MLILLAGIYAGPACVTGANVEYEIRAECMRPGAAVVSTFTAAGGRSFGTNGIENGDVLLRVAEEDVVVIVEAMIDPDLETV